MRGQGNVYGLQFSQGMRGPPLQCASEQKQACNARRVPLFTHLRLRLLAILLLLIAAHHICTGRAGSACTGAAVRQSGPRRLWLARRQNSCHPVLAGELAPQHGPAKRTPPHTQSRAAHAACAGAARPAHAPLVLQCLDSSFCSLNMLVRVPGNSFCSLPSAGAGAGGGWEVQGHGCRQHG